MNIISQISQRVARLLINRNTLKVVQIIQPFVNIPLIYISMINLDVYRNKGNYENRDDYAVLKDVLFNRNHCNKINDCDDLIEFINALSSDYIEMITYIFIVFNILFSFIWNFGKLIFDMLHRRKYASAFIYVKVLQILISFELLAIWVTLAYSTLSYPSNGLKFETCISGKGVDLKLLFADRFTAFVFVNIEALIAPLIIPLSALLLIQMQKRRELQLLRYSLNRTSQSAVSPICMLLCLLCALIIIVTCFYFIFGTGNHLVIVLAIINCVLHLYQFLFLKTIIKSLHQLRLKNDQLKQNALKPHQGSPQQNIPQGTNIQHSSLRLISVPNKAQQSAQKIPEKLQFNKNDIKVSASQLKPQLDQDKELDQIIQFQDYNN